jgi:hypothetical protein
MIVMMMMIMMKDIRRILRICRNVTRNKVQVRTGGHGLQLLVWEADVRAVEETKSKNILTLKVSHPTKRKRLDQPE